MTRVRILCDDPPLTVQGFKDQCDLRKLVCNSGLLVAANRYLSPCGKLWLF